MKRSIIDWYAKKLNQAKTAQEIESLRNQFYDMAYSENTLDVWWEEIVTGEKVVGRPRGVSKSSKKRIILPMRDIYESIQFGKSIYSVARDNNVSPGTIRNRLKEGGLL